STLAAVPRPTRAFALLVVWFVAGIGLLACASSPGNVSPSPAPRPSAAPTPAPPSASASPAPPPRPPCDVAAEQRARVPGVLKEGRLDRTVRVIERADALCPSSAPETWEALVKTLVELGRWQDARKVADAIDGTGATQPARAAAKQARD